MIGASCGMSTSAVLWPCGTKVRSVSPLAKREPAGSPKSLTTIATLSRSLSLMQRGCSFAATDWSICACLRSRRVGKGATRRAHHLHTERKAVGTLRFAHPTTYDPSTGIGIGGLHGRVELAGIGALFAGAVA